MDRRGWPWKKKSTDKTIAENMAAIVGSDKATLASVGSLSDKENYNKANYVQISLDSYTLMTGFEAQVNTLEGQVNILDDQIKDLNKKLSEAHSEITAKGSLVEQHAKIAEEAVSGWEKADAESLALKLQLESVTLLKLAAEDRACHLDGALKECMREIRCVKEENEQRLHEVILAQTEQWDKIKLELEEKIIDLDQELLRSTAQNAALSRSLQERSNMLMKIKEEKFQAEAEIEHLKENIQSYEKEINSLKYEVHVVSKELDIRSEEKNMSIKLAEATNKQHLECGKKIAKLEAECQRLRCLVRKKLPGPAALAQMKLEVENLGQDFSEPRLRNPVKGPNLHLSQLPDFSNETLQQNQKEIEFLTTRLLAMEDETKMLKEALAARNHELLTSRSMYAEVAGRLQNLESQQDLNLQRSSPRSKYGIPAKGSSSQIASSPACVTSLSEDGTDEEGSCVESLAASLICDLPHFRGKKSLGKTRKHDISNHLELMDDFLEMERLARLSNDSYGANSIRKDFNHTRGDIVCQSISGNLPSEWPTDSNPNQATSSLKSSAIKPGSCVDHQLLLKLLSRISIILESQTKDTGMDKILEEIKCAMQDIQDSVYQKSIGCFFEGAHLDDASHHQEACPQDTGETKDSKILLGDDGKPCTAKEHDINQDLVAAVSQIHKFVLSLGDEAMQIPDTSTVRNEMSKSIEDFSTSVDKFLSNKTSLVDLFLGISHVLIKASELRSNVLDCKDHEGEINTFKCIDKVALLENQVVRDESSRHISHGGCDHNPCPTSDPEFLQEESLTPGFGSDLSSCNCSIKDVELLQSCKDSMEMDLATCAQDLENTRSQLKEMEQLVTELKSKLALSEKSRSLIETQLKCMTESYKSLELHVQELEAEVITLQEKMENLNYELQEERDSHQDAVARCEHLQEQLKRFKSYSLSLLSSDTDLDVKSTQEREMAAAAEKLAECQETIDILGRQLKSLQPQSKFIESQDSKSFNVSEKQAISNSRELNQAEILHASPRAAQDINEKLQLHTSNSPSSPSNIEPNLLSRSPLSPSHQHNKPKKSSSSSAIFAPEKHIRGISNFFASRGKNRNGQ